MQLLSVARLLPLAVMTVLLVLAPFTKVEESFNMQAMHDLLFLSTNSLEDDVVGSSSGNSAAGRTIADFDHHAFPGVVPRTFAGAIAVTAVAAPVVRLVESAGLSPAASALTEAFVAPGSAGTRLWAQLLCRWILGAMVCLAIDWLGSSLASATKYADAGRVLSAVCAVQFHLMFYASRPLPNTFALILVCVAAGFYLRSRAYCSIMVLGVAACVFRFDVAVIAGPFALLCVLAGDVSFFRGLFAGLFACAASLALTIPIDSFFWQRLLWPEGAVLWFNTALNKSHEWGTSPFHWYFTSVVPRALGFLLPTFPFLFFWQPSRRVRLLVASAVIFMFLYSFLPHKELRFVMVAFPVLFLPLSHGARVKYPTAFGFLWCGNVALCIAFAMASVGNYPGGEALGVVHSLHSRYCRDDGATTHGAALDAKNSGDGDAAQPVRRVYLDAFACMNGVSRFGKVAPAGGAMGFSATQQLRASIAAAFEGAGLSNVASQWLFGRAGFSYGSRATEDTKTNNRCHPSSVRWEYSKDPATFNSSANYYAPGGPGAIGGNATDFDFIVVRYDDVFWHLSKGVYAQVATVNTFDGIEWRRFHVRRGPFLSVMRRISPRTPGSKKTCSKQGTR